MKEKISRKCHRTKVIKDDFESSTKIQYLQPIFAGFRSSNENLPFKTTTAESLSHHEVQYIYDRALQLGQVITAPMPEIPLDVSEDIASLSTETDLHRILSRIVLFISERIKVNLMKYNLTILIYLMRMTTVITYILAKQLGVRPDADNHWTLRDYASSRCAQMIFLRTFHNERLPLVIDYGVLDGLCEMDQKIIGELVFPIIRALGGQIVKSCENPLLSPIDKITIN
ncbi:unnamed protein product [Adineta steineri]|uniref:TAF6 C-terminal HEAT repeat domain-containing protein n=2 Tax=Adineta steineri TaxID=433720 RepID=A0A818XM60_9BILA|nr:unnamed protein product [Adineta steineri]